MEEETRQIVRNVVREAVAVLFVLTTLALFLASNVDIEGLTVTLSQFQTMFIDTWMFLFIGAGGFLVFGKRAVDQAVEVWQSVQGDGE